MFKVTELHLCSSHLCIHTLQVALSTWEKTAEGNILNKLRLRQIFNLEQSRSDLILKAFLCQN